MNSSLKYIILVAEDDEDDRFLLTQAFAHYQSSCQLRFFSDGQQLLQALSDGNTNELPDLILLDLNMPVLDGFTTLSLLKSDPQLASIPVVILTTSESKQDRKRCLDTGANAFLTKPTTFSQFATVIDHLACELLRTPNRSSAQ